MRPFTFCQSLFLLLALAAGVQADARTEHYKTIGDVSLDEELPVTATLLKVSGL